jgi:hypothetical protein
MDFSSGKGFLVPPQQMGPLPGKNVIPLSLPGIIRAGSMGIISEAEFTATPHEMLQR